MTSIYVSSLAFKGLSIQSISALAQENGFAIEFTSNIPYYAGIIDDFQKAAVKRMAHNYFPTPKVPFVLNLASTNKAIREQSIQHCIQGLHLCNKVNAPFFAAHAGFCIDPKPNELGRKFSAPDHIDRAVHVDIFLQSIRQLVETAASLNIPFLFENNVLIMDNVLSDGTNPLLCCEAVEIIKILKEINSEYCGFLLDTAHLKVSCKTLGLDRDDQMKILASQVTAIHHSDNEGHRDNNQPLTPDYWFLKHLPNFKDCVQVIEVHNLTTDGIKRHLTLLNGYGIK